MKKRVVVVGLALIVLAAALTPQPTWKTEHHDTMLIPPKAAHISFLQKGDSDELTYTVEEPYPASKFLQALCEQLRLRHWAASGQGGCPNPKWMAIPPQSRDQYVLTLVWDRWDNENETWEYLSYELKYPEAKNEHYLRTLHVDTYAPHNPPIAHRPPVNPSPVPSEAYNRLLMFGLLAIYLILMGTAVWLIGFTRFRPAVFYSGPSAWLTGINLVFFGPALVAFFSLGEILMAAAWPAQERIPGSGALVAAVGLWVVLAVCSKIGYAAAAMVLVPAGGILLSKRIPRNVKVVHALVGFLNLSFFVICIVFFSGPLIRW